MVVLLLGIDYYYTGSVFWFSSLCSSSMFCCRRGITRSCSPSYAVSILIIMQVSFSSSACGIVVLAVDSVIFGLIALAVSNAVLRASLISSSWFVIWLLVMAFVGLGVKSFRLLFLVSLGVVSLNTATPTAGCRGSFGD